MTLILTELQFETVRNMIDFATWHAADGMSPAFSSNFLEDQPNEAAFNARYKEQYDNIKSVRVLFELDPDGDYANIVNPDLVK